MLFNTSLKRFISDSFVALVINPILLDEPRTFFRNSETVLMDFILPFSAAFQVDLQERRSRRDMSPQGRKRVASMVAKDYRTVSGVGQGFHNQMTNEVSDGI